MKCRCTLQSSRWCQVCIFSGPDKVLAVFGLFKGMFLLGFINPAKKTCSSVAPVTMRRLNKSISLTLLSFHLNSNYDRHETLFL